MQEKISMIKRIDFSFRANIDIIISYEFYASIRLNLGEEFLNELSDCFKKIQSNSESFIMIENKFRQIVVKKFPFIILYEICSDKIVILKVFHTSQNPKKKFK